MVGDYQKISGSGLEECPDLEGIETAVKTLRASTIDLGLEECPDLEGIET